MYRWKGRIVSKKQYERKLLSQQCGLRSMKTSNESVEKAEEEIKVKTEKIDVEKKGEVIDGRRIVDISYLGEQLWCGSCKGILSLQYIEREIRKGLGSIFQVRCHTCSLINEVKTSKEQSSLDKRSQRFNINSESLLGAFYSGIGWTELDKLFSCMDIPCYNFQTYKRYENEVGQAMEVGSCENPAQEGRQMTEDETSGVKE